MPASARSQIVPPDEVGVYHCIAGACTGRFFAVSIPSLDATTSIAKNGFANDLSCLPRFSRQSSADPMRWRPWLHARGNAWLQGSNAAALAFR